LPGTRNASTSSGGSAASLLFSTNFPAAENPISQGGIWFNGGTDGGSGGWLNVQTSIGQAYASGTSNGYNDAICALKTPSFSADQWAQGTVFLAGGYSPTRAHEIELHLRFSYGDNNTHGYEILWGIHNGGSSYMAVVRWNGEAGNYTPIYDPGDGSIGFPTTGDVIYAQIVGDIITVKKNGVAVTGFSAVDISTASAISSGVNTGTVKWTTGQPGMGFWASRDAVGAGDTVAASFGWSAFSAGSL
jgi:hypothetical protein